MNYFLGTGFNLFARIEELDDEVNFLTRLRNLHYRYFHFGYRLELEIESDEKEEWQEFCNKVETEWEEIKDRVLSDGKVVKEIVKLNQMDFDNYYDARVEEFNNLLDKARSFLDDDTMIAFNALSLTKKTSGVKINEVDIDKFSYSKLVGAKVIDDFLSDIVEILKEERVFFRTTALAHEQILQLREIIYDYALEDIGDEFINEIQKILSKWQSNTNSDIAFVTPENFYNKNGEQISKELKSAIEKIFLKNDREYQKFIKEFEVGGIKVNE
ncbi:hypothetical protein OFO01_07105 [Campylobacter sp. JMF_01 NE2]|uniref:hypothetical protein n=1 Tax=unclassified Campylobacter TaxID=2593542 RepID=UPI0022E9F12D|nr:MULTISPECIES: hypothetical protein [unclassified Campylobacter]MDA3053269.1 hypothetical protein [Campylobacter sp. JMF_03 NE3]MDA3067548.1 hypothetical protein [Campylobacter sp. JMF_01 NE2]